MLAHLAAFAAALTPVVSDAPSKRVLLVGVDGCRPDALLKADAPNLKRLRAEGATSDKAQTGDITVSGPGWSSMLTGVWRQKHGVRGNDFAGKNLAEHPSFLGRVKARHPQWRTASFATWAPIHQHIVLAADNRKTFKKDAEATAAAVAELKTADPVAVFVDLDETDGAGHAHGFSPSVPQYLAAIHDADARLGEMLAAIKARSNAAREDWLVLVTTDHGGSGKAHGRDIPEHRTIFVIVHGKGVKPGEIVPPPGIVDVPVTALTHLGLADPKWQLDGKPVGLRDGPGPVR